MYKGITVTPVEESPTLEQQIRQIVREEIAAHEKYLRAAAELQIEGKTVTCSLVSR